MELPVQDGDSVHLKINKEKINFLPECLALTISTNLSRPESQHKSYEDMYLRLKLLNSVSCPEKENSQMHIPIPVEIISSKTVKLSKLQVDFLSKEKSLPEN